MVVTSDASPGALQFAADTPVPHGGDVGEARRLFPGAVEPFIDLSTGINPHPYPLPDLPAEIFARLPEADALAALTAVAARTYSAPSPVCVVPAPGTQILLPLTAGLAAKGRAVILMPSYSEYARAAALAGHEVRLARTVSDCADADLVIVGNPNNPDGRVFDRAGLLDLADKLDRHGGLLVIDEAFMDAGPPGASLAPDVLRANILVLRSFGKFFGLGGLRLGFAIAAPASAARLAATLGPWAISGPALAVGTTALADAAWIARTRRALAQAAQQLDAVLVSAGLDIIGGTSLFRLARTQAAPALFQRLGCAGILVRRFPDHPDWLRFGLPADEGAWRRLADALNSDRESR
jgi:cobalamin biosynthesis protein CobC